MDFDKKQRDNNVSHPMFLSDNFSDKPYMNDEFPFQVPSPKDFLQDFHYLDEHQFQGNNGLASNPIFGVPNVSNFDPSDPFPYGSSTNMDFLDYECKPFADNNNIGGNGQVMDNFHGGNGYLSVSVTHRNPIDMIGSSRGRMPFDFQEVKPMNFVVVPDEVSCVTATNHGYYRKLGDKNTRAVPSTRRASWKGRKKHNVVKGQWTVEEDRLLIRLVDQYGVRKWSQIAQMLPGRIGKQCRERWHNHLRPDIKKDIWSEEEDKVLIQAHKEIGNKWAEIAKRLAGRTENSIKNHWNATKRKQYSKRKCRSKYPRGSILQEYIKSLNLDAAPTGRYGQGKVVATTSPDAILARLDRVPTKAPNQNQTQVATPDLCLNDRLVPNFYFNEVPDFDFDEKMFQEGCCSIDALLDEMPCGPVGEENNLELDAAGEDGDGRSPLMDFEVKEELDLVEMISHQSKK